MGFMPGQGYEVVGVNTLLVNNKKEMFSCIATVIDGQGRLYVNIASQ